MFKIQIQPMPRRYSKKLVTDMLIGWKVARAAFTDIKEVHKMGQSYWVTRDHHASGLCDIVIHLVPEGLTRNIMLQRIKQLRVELGCPNGNIWPLSKKGARSRVAYITKFILELESTPCTLNS